MYLNWKNCKALVLELAKRRTTKFTRVSGDVKEHLECVIRNECHRIVHSHPSMGVTIQMGTHKRKKEQE